jgi:hypothetical protein
MLGFGPWTCLDPFQLHASRNCVHLEADPASEGGLVYLGGLGPHRPRQHCKLAEETAGIWRPARVDEDRPCLCLCWKSSEL